MGEFHDAVSTLLEAFSRGLAIIKRKKEQLPQDSSHQVEEKYLSKTLRKSRTDVKDAYSRDLAKFGQGFAAGDVEARSSLLAILFRLNAGFVSVIERFTKGKTTKTDYIALMNLSNASRMEAISTFDQLSKRVSRCSLALVPTSSHPEMGVHSHKRKAKNPSSTNGSKHRRSKCAPSLSISSAGWVRSKPYRKSASGSESSGSSTLQRSPRKSDSPTHSQRPPRVASPPQQRTPSLRPSVDKRKSIMSFASDSTRLGEIPEHKRAWQPVLEGSNVNHLVRAYYPLEPYQEPEKQRSRFMRLFRK